MKKYCPQITVYAFDKKKKILKSALKEKNIDGYFTQSSLECFDVDLIIFALPIYTIEKVFDMFSPYIKPNTLITDVGSTKLRLEKFFLQRKVKYIGSHPLAGSEKSGYKYSSPELLRNRICLIIPNKYSKKESNLLKNFWKKLKMRVEIVTAEKHDKMLAITSHFIHLIAFAYTYFLKTHKITQTKNFAGPSFNEFTRIARSNPYIWTDILLDNKKELINIYKNFSNSLEKFINILLSGDNKKILKILKQLK